MLVKASVSLSGLRPEMLIAILVAYDVFTNHNADFVITSVLDGKHKSGSLHYVGLAVDIRTRDLTRETAFQLSKQIAACLTSEFDVILEGDHLHIEFQPKT